MILKIEDKEKYFHKSRFLKGAIKAINKKQEKTIERANKIIGDVENFEKEVVKKFLSYL